MSLSSHSGHNKFRRDHVFYFSPFPRCCRCSTECVITVGVSLSVACNLLSARPPLAVECKTFVFMLLLLLLQLISSRCCYAEEGVNDRTERRASKSSLIIIPLPALSSSPAPSATAASLSLTRHTLILLTHHVVAIKVYLIKRPTR